MTQLWPQGQAIAVTLGAQGEPLAFTWHGRQHGGLRVVQRWQVDLAWWQGSGRVWRSYWAVITQDGLMCVLYHDRLRGDGEEGAWRLVRLYD
jgi:hypothetical protein